MMVKQTISLYAYVAVALLLLDFCVIGVIGGQKQGARDRGHTARIVAVNIIKLIYYKPLRYAHAGPAVRKQQQQSATRAGVTSPVSIYTAKQIVKGRSDSSHRFE
jgi:hypothetical protein